MAEKLGKQRALCSSELLWLHYCLSNLIYSQPGCACKSSSPGRDLFFRQHTPSFQEYFILQAGLPGFEPLWNPLFLRRRRENPIFSMCLAKANFRNGSESIGFFRVMQIHGNFSGTHPRSTYIVHVPLLILKIQSN